LGRGGFGLDDGDRRRVLDRGYGLTRRLDDGDRNLGLDLGRWSNLGRRGFETVTRRSLWRDLGRRSNLGGQGFDTIAHRSFWLRIRGRLGDR